MAYSSPSQDPQPTLSSSLIWESPACAAALLVEIVNQTSKLVCNKIQLRHIYIVFLCNFYLPINCCSSNLRLASSWYWNTGNQVASTSISEIADINNQAWKTCLVVICCWLDGVQWTFPYFCMVGGHTLQLKVCRRSSHAGIRLARWRQNVQLDHPTCGTQSCQHSIFAIDTLKLLVLVPNVNSY